MVTSSCRGSRALLLGLLLTLPVALQAQQSQTNVDAIAPVVQHDPVADEVSAGTPLTISATVTDNVSVKTVTLYHRTRGEADYQSLAMERLGDTSMYVATLETDAVIEPALEYYIEAADAAGNILLVGYAFSPLIVSVTQGTFTAADAAPAASAQDSGGSKPKTWLWVLVGVGAAALAIGAAGGSGGGSSGDGRIAVSGPLPE